jgi:hypothetical protein
MLGYTLKEYKESYRINLNTYLTEYEDNSKSEFLKKELAKIQLYSTALHKISRAIIGYDRPKNATIRSGEELLLKQQHFKVYDNIVSNIDLSKGDFFGQQLKTCLISIDCVKLENYIKSASLISKFISDEFKYDNSSALTNTDSSNSFNKNKFDQVISEDKFTDKIWFKAGVLFASGKVLELYEKYKSEKGHFLKITLELGFKNTDRPYFSETLNNSTNDPKNIFKDFNKMTIIHKYCVENDISLSIKFVEAFTELQTKEI